MSREPYNFKKQDKVGDGGQEISERIMNTDPTTKSITLFSKTSYEQKVLKIDSARELIDGSVELIDAKEDTYKSDNFFAEWFHNLATRVLGCFLTSAADVWHYHSVAREETHIVPLKAAQNYVRTELKKNKMKWGQIRSVPNEGWDAGGYPIPYDELAANVPGWRVIKDEDLP